MFDNVWIVLEIHYAIDVVQDDALVLVVAGIVLEVRPVSATGVVRVTAASFGFMLDTLDAVIFYNARGLDLLVQLLVVVLLQVVDLAVEAFTLMRPVEFELDVHQ